MEFLKETTVWKTDYRVPSHTYIVDGAKAIGYIPEGQDAPVMFRAPQSFSKTGRKFTKVQGVPLARKETRRRVEGSKGAVYYVDDTEGTCTCAGYTYRGYCKHLQ